MYYKLINIPFKEADKTVLNILAKDITDTISHDLDLCPINYCSIGIHDDLLKLFGYPLRLCTEEKKVMIGHICQSSTMKTLTHYALHHDSPGIILFDNSRFFKIEEEIPVESYLKNMPALEVYLRNNGNQHVKAYMCRQTLFLESKETVTIENFIAVIFTYICTYIRENFGNFPEHLKEFFGALLTQDVDKANLHINNLIDRTALRKKQFQNVKHMFKSTLNSRKTQMERQVRDTANELEITHRRYTKLLKELKEWQALYNGLKDADEEVNQDEIIEWLIKNPYIEDLTVVTSNKLYIHYKAPIKYFEHTIVDILLNKHPDNNFLKILKQGKYEMWTECTLKLNTETFDIDVDRQALQSCFIKHPHLAVYGCTGNHLDEVQEWVNHNDFIGAFEQISYMVLELNLADNIVFDTLYRTLENEAYNMRTFRDPETGIFKSYREITKEMNDEESTTNE